MEITDEKILQAGYTEYDPSSIHGKYVTKFFQKCINCLLTIAQKN